MKSASATMSLPRPDGLFVAILYLLLGAADLVLSLAAFRLGVAEGNPVLAFMAARGLFVPAKVALTLLAAGLIVVVYRSPRARLLCWAGVALMALVDGYHTVGLMVELHPH